MELGAFSVSLAVKDLEKSKAFYEKLGFEVFGGNAEQNWLMLRNGDHVLGLFQGMFPKNILTFNPGWNQQTETQENFTDIREIAEKLKQAGLELQQENNPGAEGPASFVLEDPDGNPILIDQHV